jgi:hypothetical protein
VNAAVIACEPSDISTRYWPGTTVGPAGESDRSANGLLRGGNKHKLRACCCLNLEILDHFPEIKDAMIGADWD